MTRVVFDARGWLIAACCAASPLAQAIDITALSITGGIAEAAPGTGGTYYTSHFDFVYTGGKVILSAKSDGSGKTKVDDQIVIQAGQGNFTHTYSQNCALPTGLKPKNIAQFFSPGLNRVTVVMSDTCGGAVSSSSLWLSNLPSAFDEEAAEETGQE